MHTVILSFPHPITGGLTMRLKVGLALVLWPITTNCTDETDSRVYLNRLKGTSERTERSYETGKAVHLREELD